MAMAMEGPPFFLQQKQALLIVITTKQDLIAIAQRTIPIVDQSASTFPSLLFLATFNCCEDRFLPGRIIAPG
jgi:hypothetical protein